MIAKQAITDTVRKDIVKQMKAALGDKSLPVQRAAAAVHISLCFSFSVLIRWLRFSGCRIQAIRFESLPPGLYVASAILHHFDCRKLS